MTITFKCPECGQLCAFPEKHAGRRARCTKCNQRFTIPAKQGDNAVKLKTAPETPLPGFYKAALQDNRKIFTDFHNITPFVFLTALVCFRFFLAHTDYSFTVGNFRVQMPLGWIVIIITWGCQIWYYMETVYAASLNNKQLPEIDIGFGFEFFGNIIKSIYLFVVAVILAEAPFLILVAILKSIGLTQAYLLQPITLGGAFLLPTMIFILSTGRDLWLIFRVDYLIKPLIKSPLPYSVVAILIAAGAIIEWETVGYGEVRLYSNSLIAVHLLANIGSAVFLLIVMRVTGRYAYHYRCYMPQ
jgi:DNA-directed RNA polymerase subunit RPC12/RpoP